MFIRHLCLFVLFLAKTSSKKCVCAPFWKCTDHKLNDYSFDGLDGCDGYFDVCCSIKCGQKKSEVFVDDLIRNRLTGSGGRGEFGEFPWMVGVLDKNSYKCGGSLIHPQVVLTAAHCVQKTGFYRVRAGEWDWTNKGENLEHQDRIVQKVVTHPNYNPNSLINDIALLILDSPFHLQDNVGVMCLPPQNSTPFPQECVVTGWGKTWHESHKNEAVLKKALFPLVSHSRCEEALQRAHLGPMFRLDSSFMCAGGLQKDACEGDGGSPLICEVKGEKQRYQQFGIVSWGLTCGVYGAPGVYVNVALFINWIDTQMALNGFDSDIYKMSD